MLYDFSCNADKLLKIVADFYGINRWTSEAQRANIHSLFLVVLKRIYNGESPEMAVCAMPSQFRWYIVSKIVSFGKDNGIPEQDWLEALACQISSK